MSTGYSDYDEVAEFYEVIDAYRNRSDVSFYVNYAKQAGGKVLELGCGTGRVLIPSARAGIEITGFDLSDSMLRICKRKLQAETQDVQQKVKLIKGDMSNFALNEKFRLITTPFRPFQHLETVETQISCLECAHKHLEMGGRFILDLFNPSMKYLIDESRLAEFDDGTDVFTMLDDRKVQRKARIVKQDFFNQINDIELIYYVTHPDGGKERLVHSFKMRYLFRFEAEHLLVRCGFKIENVFGNYEKETFGSVDYPGELILVAVKP